jgi:toxin-antitoxin system PIN domain toxin
MIGLDTNLLIYARRRELPQHTRAAALLRQLAEGQRPWALAWPCVYEYVRVVTHAKVFDPPSDLAAVLEDLDSLLESPSLTLLGEGPAHAAHMRRMLGDGHAVGNLAHDAHIAALAIEHGVTEFWTADRDFSRFPGLRSRNPLTT